VFRYVTVRTAMAIVTAMVLSFLLGPPLIRRLRQWQWGQYIREEGPKHHQRKAGTPTMGGLLIVLAVSAAVLLWADLTEPYPWIALFTLWSFGALGFWGRLGQASEAAEPGSDGSEETARPDGHHPGHRPRLNVFALPGHVFDRSVVSLPEVASS
jgi:hypothetical protein